MKNRMATNNCAAIARTVRTRLGTGASLVGLTVATMLTPQTASAQAAPPPNLVSACSGVSLPRSVVTDILTPVVNGIASPVQNTVNPILGVLGGLLPLVPPLSIDTTGLLRDAAAGAPITLQALNVNGVVVGPADRCDTQADSFSLRTPAGIAIGGNRITGLGATGLEAVAGESNSIAFGNLARTDATAAGAIALGAASQIGANAGNAVALGTGATATAANGVALGAGSLAARGAIANYAALGLAGTQTSAGEVSVGAAGAERQITNVAAGTAASDAATVGQLTGVQAQIGTLASDAVRYDSAAHDRVSLTGPAGTVIANVAPGRVDAASSEAVNGSQLFATNTNVANTNTAVTNLTTSITNGGIGAVQYSNAATPTVPNGGVPTNDVTLVGGAAGPVGLHNVADGAVVAGSTDAVNGGQLATVSGQVGTLATLAVQYDDATRTRVTLGGAAAAPVALGNVAAGTLSAGSTEAVNGGQLTGLGTSVAAGLGGQSLYDAATNQLLASIGFGGVQYGSVQAAFDAVNGSVNGGGGIRYFRVLSTRADATVSGTDSVAIGPEAAATAANSVALGTGSSALRGATTGYAALGLAGVQNAVGEVSVGSAGAERQITNVAAGVAATDAANVGQVAGVAAQVAALGGTAVQYDDTTRTRVTLAGTGGTTITNVAAGTVAAGSTDAVNGSQLNATNVQVANNTTAITNLSNQVASGGTGPVQYSNPGSATTPNGGTRTNDLTLVGAAAAPVGLHNVAGGAIAAGSTDAVNGGQVYALALTAVNAVSYDTDATGTRTNTVTLAGGNAAAPVAIGNVAAGTLAAGSTQAVNGGQLFTTNQAVATAQGTAASALALGSNSVQYGPGRTNVTFNAGGSATVLSNVAAGVSATDAANVGQLNTGINSAVTQANSYTDGRIAALDFDLRRVRRDSFAGTSGALAAAGLPQAYEAGKGMIAVGGGTYAGQSAFAVGMSKAFNDGHTVVKLSGTYDSQGRAGASGGLGYQF